MNFESKYFQQLHSSHVPFEVVKTITALYLVALPLEMLQNRIFPPLLAPFLMNLGHHFWQ